MGIETVSLIIASFVCASLSIAALMRNPRSRLCLYFACLTALLFLHDALAVIERFSSTAAFVSPRLHSFSILCLGPVALLFLKEAVPRYSHGLSRILSIYFPLLGLFVAGMAFEFSTTIYEVHSFLSHLLFLFPAVIWLLALGYGQRMSPLNREKLRLKYAWVGGTLTLALYLTDLVNFAGLEVPPLGTLARILYLIFLFQTFIQKELMTPEEVFAKLSLWSSLSLVLSAIYALLVSWVGDRPGLFLFNTFIASFVILILFDPIRKLSWTITRRFFGRQNTLLEIALNQLSLELMGAVPTLPELAQKLSHHFSKMLQVESMALYVIDQERVRFLRVSSASNWLEEFSAQDSLVEYMALRRNRPFVLETIENDRDSFGAPQPRKFCQLCLENMRSLGADLILPFSYDSRVLGFFVARTGERVLLSSEQLRLFVPLCRQVATLLNNVEVLDHLRHREKLAAVGEMAAGLAHEIKNPLGAIKGAAQLLKSDANNEFVGIILDETNRLSEVLSDFLEYAKPRRDQLPQPCRVIRVIEHTAQLVLRDTQVKFELVTPARDPIIEIDPDVLKQILVNLFLNAVQAMAGNTIHPEIRVTLSESKPKKPFAFSDSIPRFKLWEGWDMDKILSQQKPFIEIEVADNGPGIELMEREKVFLPFYTTKQKGTGLGLSICQRLVEGIGGTLSFRPNLPKGAVFTLHLPLQPAQKLPECLPGKPTGFEKEYHA